MSRDDEAGEIRRRLEDGIEGVLDALAPGWKRRGGTAYLTPKSAKDLGSFTVSLKNGQRLPRGCWYRFSQNVGGGSVELVSYILSGRKDDYPIAFKWAKAHLGMERESDEDREHWRADAARREQEREARDRHHAEEVERKKEARQATAAEVWAQTMPLAGTRGDAYLQARGIAAVKDWPWSPDETIRFHHALVSELDKAAGKFPAIIAKVVDPFGDMLGVWQIFLDRDKPTKAPLDNPKVGLGPAAGGAVRIGGDADDIDGAEGLETALAAWQLGRYARPSWAFLSTSGMVAFEPPLFLKKVRTWPDGDPGIMNKHDRSVLDPPGMKAARSLHEKLVTIGIANPINEMTRHGDALDLLIARKKLEKADA